MSIYRRYKTAPGGFRKLVELFESTPPERRKKMIDAGMAEDSAYTRKALQYLMDFDDVIKLPDMELAEVVNQTPARVLFYAISTLDAPNKDRFLSTALPKMRGELNNLLDEKCSARDVSGARYKVVSIARELEKKGYVKTKIIPESP